MMGQRGANLESTRRIWRRMARSMAECRAVVAQKRLKPGYDESKCRTADLAADYERSLAPGSPPPVGCLKGLWAQVCQEYHDKPPAFKPRKSKPDLTLPPRVA